MKKLTIIIILLLAAGCSKDNDPKPVITQDFKGTVDRFVDDASTGGVTVNVSNLSVTYKSFPDETTNDTYYSKDKIVVDKEFYNSQIMEASPAQFIMIYQILANMYTNKQWDCYGGMRRITGASEINITGSYYIKIYNYIEAELFHDDKTVYNEMKADFESNNIPCNK